MSSVTSAPIISSAAESKIINDESQRHYQDRRCEQTTISVGVAKNTHDGAEKGSLGSIIGEARLHVRVPFVVSVDSSEASCGGGEVYVTVEVTGKLRRGGCMIPVFISRKLCITVVPLMSLKLAVHHTCQSANSGGRHVLLQAELVNSTVDVLEITGYGVVPIDASGKLRN